MGNPLTWGHLTKLKEFFERDGVDGEVLQKAFESGRFWRVTGAILEAAGIFEADTGYKALGELFQKQLDVLKERGCPQAIIDALQLHRNEVLLRAAKIGSREGYTPFIPVIRRSIIPDLSLLIVSMKNDPYRSEEKPELSRATVDSFADLYYIFDVEDGTATKGLTPAKAEKMIVGQGRRGLTLEEVAALAAHSNVLRSHGLYAIGSKKEKKGVPYLWDYWGQINSTYAGPHEGGKCTWAPSCMI